MNDRIKELRAYMKLSQEEFGKLLGITKSGVSEIESGRRKVTEQHIIMLKTKGVNEEWLRTGEGKMFIELDIDNQLMEWAARVLKDESDSFRRRFLKMLMGMHDDDWEIMYRNLSVLFYPHIPDDKIL